MIPILYEATEKEFKSNGLGRLRDCISCIVTEERNGIYECEFQYPVNGVNYDRIQVGRIIAVTHDDTSDIQPFDIVGFEKPIEGIVTFHAVHISYRLNKMTVDPAAIEGTPDAEACFDNDSEPTCPFAFHFFDEPRYAHVAAADGLPHTIREILGGVEGSILDTFGGEYKFDRFHVYLMDARGVVRNIVVRYGVNMIEYNDEADATESFSACIPYWTDGTNTVIGDRTDSTGSTPSGRIECVPLDLSDKFETQPTKSQVENEGKKYMRANGSYLMDQTINISFMPFSDYNKMPPEPPEPPEEKYETVLYSDGTLIINEPASKREANIAKHGAVGKTYHELDDNNTYSFNSADDQPWHDDASQIKRVEKGSDAKGRSLAYWFKGLSNVEVIDISWLDTSDVTNMTEMFAGCTNLKTIIVSTKWDTSRVTSSTNMFNGCTNIRGGCRTAYDSSHKDKSWAKVDGGVSRNDFGYLTLGSDYITVLYSDGTFVINEDMDKVFSNSITHRYNALVPNVFGYDDFTSKSRQPWTNEGTSVTTVKFGSAIRPTSMEYWFTDFRNVTSFNFTNLNTSSVESLHETFSNIRNGPLALDLSSFNTSACTTMRGMFYNSQGITSLNTSSFNTENVTTMESMYAYTSLTTINIRNFNTPSLTRTGAMFDHCSNLTTIYASSGFDVSNVSNSNNMFRDCTNLVGGAGTPFNGVYIDKARAKIDGGSLDPGYFTA